MAEPLALKLIEHKAEVLRVLAPALIRPPALVVSTVIETLGPRPTPGQLKALGVEIAEALGQLLEEVETGHLQATPLLIAGRPLADYLGLDELARQLRQARPAPRDGEGPCFVCGSTRWWRSRAGRWMCGTCHPPAVPELAVEWRT